jgi:hypothetical protein
VSVDGPNSITAKDAREKKEAIINKEDTYFGFISHKSRIYEISKKQYNYTCAYYT